MIINIAANSKDEATLIPNCSGSFIRNDIEFIKFLSCVVNLKYDRINELLSRDIRLLSESEIKELIYNKSSNDLISQKNIRYLI